MKEIIKNHLETIAIMLSFFAILAIVVGVIYLSVLYVSFKQIAIFSLVLFVAIASCAMYHSIYKEVKEDKIGKRRSYYEENDAT